MKRECLPEATLRSSLSVFITIILGGSSAEQDTLTSVWLIKTILHDLMPLLSFPHNKII